MRRFTYISLVVLMAALLLSGGVLAEEALDDNFNDELGDIMEIEEIPDDLLAELVEFIRERDPVLERQQEILELLSGDGELAEAEAMAGETESDAVETGEEAEGDVADGDLPGYLQGSFREAELDRMERLMEAQENIGRINRELVSEFMGGLSEVFAYKHQVRNLEELYDLMVIREETVRRQVDAGLLEPEVLQDLTRELIEIRTSIADAELGKQFLRRELAFNYGGEDWQELLAMILELEHEIYD